MVFEAKFVALNIVLGALCVLCVVILLRIYAILAVLRCFYS